MSVRSTTKRLRLPAPADFLRQYVDSTPLAGAVAQMDDERRVALERQVVDAWQAFVEDGNLVLRQRVVVATAQK